MRLYLHIGYPKTGTTSLQKFFVQNERHLQRQGILYPRTGRLYNAHYLFNFAMGIGAFDTTITVPTLNNLRQDLVKEITSSGCNVIIISSEYFITSPNLTIIRDFFSGFDTTVVVYLRRHDYAFESGFAQSEKTAPTPPWGADIDSYVLYSIMANVVPYDYLHTLLRWQDIFGVQNIIVRPFEKEQNLPDLFSDFLASLNIAEDPAFVRFHPENLSIDLETILTLRCVRELNLPNEAKNKLKTIILNQKTNGSNRFLSANMRKIIIQKYEPSYKIIARKFLNRPNGELFVNLKPTKDSSIETPNASAVTKRLIGALEELFRNQTFISKII